jgi:hypothetical protein
MSLNGHMKHFIIAKESLKCKFINIGTFSTKPHYISMLEIHVVLFQNHGAGRFFSNTCNPWLH